MDTIKKKRYLAVAGPTASGKSALAVELAKILDGEVVSADSMQIYDTICIGTARPTTDEMQGIPHHLLGFLPLSQSYSVAQYVSDAKEVLTAVDNRGKLPILCGGTGLYLQSLIENITFKEDAPKADTLRAALKQRAEREGGEALLRELAAVDPITALKLHPNDHGRIIRALEVYHTTGSPISEQVQRSRQEPPSFDTCLLVLDFKDREKLYARIHARVDSMVQNGLLEEAKAVLSGPFAPTAMQAIGYKELRPYFDGELPLDEALENLKKGTRHYAKRQLSWFRRIPYARFLYVDEYADLSALTNAAVEIWSKNDERRENA